MAILALWISGCATTDDPREGGLVNGVVGLASGGYQERITEREQRYQGELEEQQRLITQAETLKQERERIAADLNQADGRLASLEQRLREQRALILREQQSAELARQKLREVDGLADRLARVKQRLDDTTPEDRSVADLQARSSKIRKDLDEIDELIGLVAAPSF